MTEVARDANGCFAPQTHASYETRRDGYCRWRCYDPAAGTEAVVYVHQLVAIADGADPYRVFAPETSVHHRDEVRWHNAAENVEVREHAEHFSHHMHGGVGGGAGT